MEAESIKEIVTQMLIEIKESNPNTYKEAFKILIILLKNLVEKKEEEFKIFKKTNKTIKEKVLVIPSILGFLEVLGYTDISDEKMKYEAKGMENIKDAIEVLESLIKVEKPQPSFQQNDIHISENTVMVYQYDLSSGMCKTMSRSLIGKYIEGVWHTAVCVFGKEYYYGGGICSGFPKSTPYGKPVKEFSMGTTTKTKQEFEAYIETIRKDFSAENYDLINHNCNHFTDKALMFLTEKHLPDSILKQHEEIMKTPMGKTIMSFMQGMNQGSNASIPNMFEGGAGNNYGGGYGNYGGGYGNYGGFGY